MSPEPIPVRSVPTLECRNCGAGAPLDEHFCRQCSRILALGRHGDYFSFLGLPRRLNLQLDDLEQRFRALSRQFHPDYYYKASPAERLASLERSSYLNEAYRTLRNPASRVEHLLAIEGLPSTTSDDGAVKVPPALLEEVFALNEELETIREWRESGVDAERVRERLQAATRPIEEKRDAHERQVQRLMTQWDAQSDAPPADRRRTLEALRECLLERKYIANLLASIEHEATHLHTQATDPPPAVEAQE